MGHRLQGVRARRADDDGQRGCDKDLRQTAKGLACRERGTQSHRYLPPAEALPPRAGLHLRAQPLRRRRGRARRVRCRHAHRAPRLRSLNNRNPWGRIQMKFYQNVAYSETDQLSEVAKIAEELGFCGLATADHLITPATNNSTYPYAPDGKAWWDPNTHFPETWSMFSVLAQHTTNLHFMPTIYIVPMRDPYTLAKSISTAAYFSDNRVI